MDGPSRMTVSKQCELTVSTRVFVDWILKFYINIFISGRGEKKKSLLNPIISKDKK